MSSMTKQMKNRLLYMVCVFLGLFLIYTIGNLVYRSLVTGDELKSKASAQQLRDITVPANRGTIYSSDMSVLAQSATVWNVQLAPKEILNEVEEQKEENPDLLDEMIADLAALLELEEEDLRSHMENVNSLYEIVKRKIEKPLADALTELKAEKGYVGIYLEEDTKRYYPYNDLASSVIGFTNSANEGAYGLESKYNSVLSGTDGRKISAKDATGGALLTTYEKTYDPIDGNSIVTTIDIGVQQYIESALDSAVAQYAPAEGAAILVMDVNTGALLGMADYPNYDLNDPYTITDPFLLDAIEATENEDDRMDATRVAWETQWSNKTITDTYEPGSVFKTVTASAALEEGTATVNSSYTCTGSYLLAGLSSPMHCHKLEGHGQQSFIEALVNSCNPAFISIGLALGQERFFKYYEAFGLTEKTGIDLPAENVGTYYDENMSDISLASCSFGQSNTVTPLQMLTAAVATINGGKLLQPYVVSKVIDQNGNTVEEYSATVKRQVISEETSAIMRDALEQVVSSNGGTNAYVSGYRIGGKSGTAQKLTDSSDTKRVFTYFVFAPADDPQVAALVLMDEPTKGDTQYANTVVGPLAAKVMSSILPYLGISPQYSEEELENQEVRIPTVLTSYDPLTAESKLVAQGLNAKIIGSGDSVVSVYPGMGTKVPRGSTVILYTEEGLADSDTVTVPDVNGYTPLQANQLLTNAGLNIRLTGGAANNSKAKVTSQSIEAGTQVPRGTVVEIECILSAEDGE